MKSATSLTGQPAGMPENSLALVSAWQRLATGQGERADFEVAMSDLAAYAGYNDITPPDAPDSVLRFNEGKRAVFARILFLVELDSASQAALRAAAKEQRDLFERANTNTE